VSKIDQLLQKEMTRKQFLLFIGSSLAGLFGLSTILGLFTKGNSTQNIDPGYGERNYGP
jgi:hypothetical protein